MVSPLDAKAKELLDGMEGVTPGPWTHCAGGCECTAILSKDHPVADVIKGEWGDTFPSLRFKDGGQGHIGEMTMEAYLEKIVYGEVSVEMAMKNRAHIARCSPANLRPILEAFTAQAERIAELERERTEIEQDYLRRHKDAVDRFEENALLTAEVRMKRRGRMREVLPPLEQAAKELMDSVSFDDNGALIGGKFVGGHGGLLSEETRRKADIVRRELERLAALRAKEP